MYNVQYVNENYAKELGEIHSEYWKVAYKDIIPDEILNNITSEKREKYFEKALKEGLEEDAIISNDKQAIGFICIGKCRDEDKDSTYGEIWGIYLLPQYWNKGIGSILINWGLEELRKRGYKKVTLWVLEENLKARRFYEKVGFKQEDLVKEICIGKTLRECRYIINIE